MCVCHTCYNCTTADRTSKGLLKDFGLDGLQNLLCSIQVTAPRSLRLFFNEIMKQEPVKMTDNSSVLTVEQSSKVVIDELLDEH